MRNLVLTVFSIAILLLAFLIGRITNNQAIKSDGLALINNSLLNRFNKPEEKAARPAGVFKITAEDGRWLKLGPTGKEVFYYLPKTGQIRAAVIAASGEAGQPETIASIKPHLQKMAWSSNNKELIADDGASLIYYNLASGQSKVLNGKIKNPVFSRDSSKIAYLFWDDTERIGQIRIGDAEGEVFKNILSTRFDDWLINWIDDNTLSLVGNGALFILDIASGNLRKILEDKPNLEILPSPDGRKLAFSSGAAPGATLNFYDLAAGAETKIAENYRASNCVWSIDNNHLYCLTGKTFSVIDTGAASPALKTIYTDPTLTEAVEPRLSGAEDYWVFRDSGLGRVFGLYLK